MRLLLLLCALTACAAAVNAESAGRHQWEGAVDISWIRADSPLDSWLERGNGKLRFGERDDGLLINRAFLEYKGGINDRWSGTLLLNANNDVAETVDVLEAYLSWRPLPSGPFRLRGRFGAFYPRLSLENVDAGWSSPYALSSSVINTWIGEELRTIGAELRLVYDLPGTGGHQLAFEGAMYGFNDPTGAILTWRGWSAHDRQTGITGRVPMPQVSAIAPWNSDGEPVPRAEPFKEIDNRPGFYVGAEWRWGRRALVRAFHYDNHADKLATSGDDYAWKTWFDHVAVQLSLPWQVGLIGQWIGGSTLMGPDLGPWHVQDVDFDSSFLLLTRMFGEHRFSARYEWFDLQPFNDPAGITNQDKGNAVAVAWLYPLTKQFRLGAEWLQIRSTHCRPAACLWTFAGLPRKTNESQVQVSLRYSFGNVRH